MRRLAVVIWILIGFTFVVDGQGDADDTGIEDILENSSLDVLSVSKTELMNYPDPSVQPNSEIEESNVIDVPVQTQMKTIDMIHFQQCALNDEDCIESQLNDCLSSRLPWTCDSWHSSVCSSLGGTIKSMSGWNCENKPVGRFDDARAWWSFASYIRLMERRCSVAEAKPPVKTAKPVEIIIETTETVDPHLPSFEEWHRQIMQSATLSSSTSQMTSTETAESFTSPSPIPTSLNNTHSSTLTPSPPSDDPVLPQTLKSRFNYASSDCAAVVLATNPTAKFSSRILQSAADQYLLDSCSSTDRHVIVELCDDVLLEYIVLANLEFFASTFRHVNVSVSDRYPPRGMGWRQIGFYEARNSRVTQIFAVKSPHPFSRYLRIDFLDHYGAEYYCPVSVLRVYGRTMIDDYKQFAEKSGDDASLTATSTSSNLATSSPIPKVKKQCFIAKRRNSCPNRQDLSFIMKVRSLLDPLPSSVPPATPTAPVPLPTLSIPLLPNILPISQQQPDENIFKALANRLQHLELNMTLTRVYMEQQRARLQVLLTKWSQKQESLGDAVALRVNATLWRRIDRLRTEWRVSWLDMRQDMDDQRDWLLDWMQQWNLWQREWWWIRLLLLMQFGVTLGIFVSGYIWPLIWHGRNQNPVHQAIPAETEVSVQPDQQVVATETVPETPILENSPIMTTPEDENLQLITPLSPSLPRIQEHFFDSNYGETVLPDLYDDTATSEISETKQSAFQLTESQFQSLLARLDSIQIEEDGDYTSSIISTPTGRKQSGRTARLRLHLSNPSASMNMPQSAPPVQRHFSTPISHKVSLPLSLPKRRKSVGVVPEWEASTADEEGFIPVQRKRSGGKFHHRRAKSERTPWHLLKEDNEA